MTIRQEEAADAETISALVTRAYQAVPYSDHREQFMVERLRMSDAFVPELSLLAEIDDEPVGHILLTKIAVRNERFSTTSLSLAKSTLLYRVISDARRRNALVREAAHWRAAQLGFRSVMSDWYSANYYERFGYQPMKPLPHYCAVRGTRAELHGHCARARWPCRCGRDSYISARMDDPLNRLTAFRQCQAQWKSVNF